MRLFLFFPLFPTIEEKTYPLYPMSCFSPNTVVVGMSGGVDSSVSALLLHKQGIPVIGLFMKNWEEEGGQCHAQEDFEDVVRVCEKIGIPYYSVRFVEEYQKEVFAHFIEELQKGFTPNPDILCNREIKFRVFFQKAQQIGGAYLATGHYCRISEEGYLLKGIDPNKDQSYFLYTIAAEVLQQVLFPIGHLPKQQVRAIAQEHGLATAAKKDSTGICFIGKRNFSEFLRPYIPYQEGVFLTLDRKPVGTHEGMAYYTIGQRKGLGIGGPGEAWFVVDKDPLENIVYVVQGEDHPALYAYSLTASDVHWIHPVELPLSCKAKIRYRQPEEPCTVTPLPGGNIFVRFTHPQRAITLRQSVVFYQEDRCLGGGMIASKEDPLYPKIY